jgi:peptidoglycan hydrolase-like protein with peptidoglycan-binding domain/tetratricopeptide (TPR) repeat protein
VSRSSRAWAKGCELVGAAARGVRRLGKLEARESLEAERLVRTGSSLATLTWVATAVMLMLAFTPALALGKSASRSSRAPAGRAAQATSHARVTRTEQSSDPPQSAGTDTRRATARVNVLAFGSGYASAHGSRAVRALQRRLTGLGYSPGPIDGRYGPLTDAAVIRFQAAHGLVVDGIDGPLTTAALASAELLLYPCDGYVPGGSGPVRALQRHLAAAGFRPGPIDGRYGALTERAVIRFQTAHHLRVDGIAGPQTLGQLQRGTQPQVHQRPHPRTAPRQVHRRPRGSRPSTKPVSPHKPAPAGKPGSTHKPASSPPKTGHHSRPTSGPSLIPWLIVIACLLLAALAGLLWHGRRRRESRPPQATAVRNADAKESAAEEGTVPTTTVPTVSTRPPEPTEPVPSPIPVEAQEVAPDREDRGFPHPGAAAFRFGGLLAEAGNHARAEDAFRRAEACGHPMAAFELGSLLLEAGDVAGAEEAFGRADQRGDPGAACNLGVLLEQRGDVAGAKLAYERADARGHAVGAWNLGSLLEQEGDGAGATAAYQRAAERGEPTAANDLGVLLERNGDRPGAEAAYRHAAGAGHAGAAFNLGALLLEAGDLAGAEGAFGLADEHGHPDAACNLGVLLEQRGDVAGARLAYQRADERGHAVGAWNLGSLLEQQSDRAGAKAAYERADQRGYAAGACSLGLLLQQEGDHVGALRAFERAGELGPPEVADLAYAAMRELRPDEHDEG